MRFFHPEFAPFVSVCLTLNVHVVCLSLLYSQLPKSFGNLTQLRLLDLSNNKLMSDIPCELSQLAELRVFAVSQVRIQKAFVIDSVSFIV